MLRSRSGGQLVHASSTAWCFDTRHLKSKPSSKSCRLRPFRVHRSSSAVHHDEGHHGDRGQAELEGAHHSEREATNVQQGTEVSHRDKNEEGAAIFARYPSPLCLLRNQTQWWRLDVAQVACIELRSVALLSHRWQHTFCTPRWFASAAVFGADETQHQSMYGTLVHRILTCGEMRMRCRCSMPSVDSELI